MAKKRYYKYLVTISVVSSFKRNGGTEWSTPQCSSTELPYYAFNKSHALIQCINEYLRWNTKHTYRYFESIIDIVKTRDYRYFEEDSF